MSELSRAELRKIIAEGYNVQEMKLLCENLDVKWEDISATETTSNMFAQEIVDYFGRRGWLDYLIQQVQEDRPNLFDSSGYQESATSYNHDDSQETHTNPVSNSDNTTLWSFLIIIAIVVAVYLLITHEFEKQRQKQPGTFVANYFDLLDKGYFQDAWERLSGDYRVNKHPTGYTPYATYYASFIKVEILRLEVVEETATMASVSVFLALTNYDDSVVNQEILYRLSRPTADDSWLIMDSSP